MANLQLENWVTHLIAGLSCPQLFVPDPAEYSNETVASTDEHSEPLNLQAYLLGRRIKAMRLLSSFTHWKYSGYSYKKIPTIKQDDEFKYAVLVRHYNATSDLVTTSLYISQNPFFYFYKSGNTPTLVHCPSYTSNTYKVYQYRHDDGYWQGLSNQTSTSNGTPGSFSPSDPLLHDLEAIWTNHDIYHAEKNANGYFIATDELYLAASEPVPDYE